MKTKIILAGILLLLSGSSFAQRIVEYGDLRTLTDAEHGTVVHYLKDGKRLLAGEYRILRGQGTDIKIVKELMGHKNIKTTEVYVHIADTYKSRIKSPLDDLLMEEDEV